MDKARNEGAAKKGRNGSSASSVEAVSIRKARQDYRVSCEVVLLTYQGVAEEAWEPFVKYVNLSLQKWRVVRWGATLEKADTSSLHFHLVLQFKEKVDRITRYFSFDGIVPNASTNDYLGEAYAKSKKLQESVNRCFFYVWADKEGTLRDHEGQPCFAGNHEPVWTKARKGKGRYQVLGKWCENLWKQRKLSHSTYEEYLFLARGGVVSRKRNLDTVRAWEERRTERVERSEAAKRVHASFAKFDTEPVVEAWLRTFELELDRYAFLVVLGPSRAAKTEYAKSLFKNPLVLKVGDLEQFPDGMRAFQRGVHDGIVLDDIRDFKFCVRHQDKLQGKVDTEEEFGTTPGGGYAYHKWLWRIPFVITANLTTRSRDLLDSNDFLGNSENRVVVHRSAQPTAS